MEAEIDSEAECDVFAFIKEVWRTETKARQAACRTGDVNSTLKCS